MTKAKNIAAYAAVAAASPYLVLKIMWLSGSTIGTNASTPDDATFYAMNLFTVLMDATAVLLALAFTRRWGRRLPAPLILFPMWVGIGFLGAIVLALPAAAAISALRGVNVFAEGGGIVEPWVYAVVYVGFVSQGVGLLTAFVLYARERWPRLPGGPLPSELGLLAKSMVGMQALLGLICLYWGLGGDAGLPAGSTSFSGRFLLAVFGLLSGAGAFGLLRLRPGPTWPALTLAWVGAGTNFAWGLWLTLNLVIDSPLSGGDQPLGLLGLVSLLRLLAGTAVGLIAATQLAQPSHSSANEPAPPQDADERAPLHQAHRTAGDERLTV
ncbi:MAG: hypothetical protein HOV77_07885 [Hamadaea sp.]|uniref:hypothetical protein n=1 Tax=Hamadaea sp. TaxID=2024425 RepID=UPI0018093A95|nr:hypothetical protein [Hamadaea sp.]NUT19091.1 hypothetical protein [Hamadaea sp.]